MERKKEAPEGSYSLACQGSKTIAAWWTNGTDSNWDCELSKMISPNKFAIWGTETFLAQDENNTGGQFAPLSVELGSAHRGQEGNLHSMTSLWDLIKFLWLPAERVLTKHQLLELVGEHCITTGRTVLTIFQKLENIVHQLDTVQKLLSNNKKETSNLHYFHHSFCGRGNMDLLVVGDTNVNKPLKIIPQVGPSLAASRCQNNSGDRR